MARVEHAIEVNAPLGRVYQQLVRFEEYPRFMKGVHSVHQLDDAHLHWHAERGGKDMEWDCEITEHIPQQCIAWRSTSGARSEGRMTLETIGPARTRIVLSVDSDDVAATGHAYQEEEDLGRLKKLIENEQGDPAALAASENGKIHIMHTGTSQPSAAPLEHSPPEHASANAYPAGSWRNGRSTYRTPPWPYASRFSGMMPAWNIPLAIMGRMAQEMERSFARLADTTRQSSHPATGMARQQGWTPAVDIAKFHDDLLILVDLPGVKKEDLDVKVIGDQLLIEGERRDEHALHYVASRRSERYSGRFSRAVTLPREIKPELTSARLHDGVLEVRIPRSHAGEQAYRVEINREFD